MSEEEELPEMLSEKELVEASLEEPTNSKKVSKGQDSSIALELGDIIEIIAPNNPEIHEITGLIYYIDQTHINIISVSTSKRYILRLDGSGRLTDESIEQIYLLNRSDEKGYARQNNLLVGTWVNIEFGGEIPVIITGQITNLEEDMIELVTYPELRTIYIDFGYKGIPENLPIISILIRDKPTSLGPIKSLTTLKEQGKDDVDQDAADRPLASIEYTETGESIISIPEGSIPDENVREKLHSMYTDANIIIFGERLEAIAHQVEIPENERRYGIDAQVNDMMDELLATVPNSDRTKMVLDNIHRLIERFKELRTLFSKYDENNNIIDMKVSGAFYKPLIEHIQNMDQNLKWLVPVVSTRKKLYDVATNIESPDTIDGKLSVMLREIEALQQKTNRNDYATCEYRIQDFMRPFEEPQDTHEYLATIPVKTNIDSIVDNLENFYSTVITEAGVVKRQYVIQRYNLGSTMLAEHVMRTGKSVYIREQVGENDRMCLKSIVMLPYPVVRFSAINLPTTNMLAKSTIHHNYFLLHRLFKKNTEIIPHMIDDLSKEFDYEALEKETGVNFLTGIHEFIIDKDMPDQEQFDTNDRFKKFLETIIPKTRVLIRLVRKYIKDKISFLDIVQHLEPFSVYPADITWKQYLEIRYFIKERIVELKKLVKLKSDEFSILKTTKYDIRSKPNSILRLLTENMGFSDLFFQTYRFLEKDNLNTTMSSQEILSRIFQTDNGALYTNIITSILISLMTPSNLIDELAGPKLDDLTDIEKIKPTDCTKRFLAKKYTSMKELQKDNNNDEIYYDKDMDDTPYAIMEKYKKEKKEMAPDLFLEFLEQSLIKKHDCQPELANALARTLIANKKQVSDGEYAMLELRPELPKDFDETGLTSREKKQIETEAMLRRKIQYYKRTRNIWLLDDSITEETFVDNNTLFCNISSTCLKNQENKQCESVVDTEQRIKELTKKRMLGEFDRRYEVSVDELETKLKNNITYHLKTLTKTQNLKEIQRNKANYLAFELGSLADTTELATSPYQKLRDMILGQDDFTSKQYNICLFVQKFCREPLVEQEEENEAWKYCKDTNMKLFPASLFRLAEAFCLGSDYQRTLDEVCADVGVFSEDGDCIVDKFSGFVLRKREFSTDEGFDESGRHITTHDIMEKDLGTVMMEAIGKKEKPVFEDPTVSTIYNIFSTLCLNISIPVDSGIDQFVVRTANQLIEKNVWSEDVYAKKSRDNEKKTGKPFKESYVDYRNEGIISITTSVLLVAIQTAIPSFQAKKTFPGCVKSFSGYPLQGGVEDMTGIKYMVCVLNKTKSSIAPWQSIQKYKVDTLESRLRTIIEKQIMVRDDIIDMYVKKREFMLLQPNLVAPDEHSITKWRNFLPPVVPIDVTKTITNMATGFSKELMTTIRDGKRGQHDLLAALNGKIIRFGYAIIEAINDIVKTKDMILKTSTGVPFIENGCCNETRLTNPILYFNESDPSIMQYIIHVIRMAEDRNIVRLATNSVLLYHKENTRIQNPSIPTGYIEDDIYAAIIHYCNFDSTLPIPEEYRLVCSEKPANYHIEWRLLEKIEFLKRNGSPYDLDHLNQLMALVRRKNIVQIDKPIMVSQVTIFKEIIEKLNITDSKVIDVKLRDCLNDVLDTYEPNKMTDYVDKVLYDLKKHLNNANKNMNVEIVNFFNRHGNLSTLEFDKLRGFLSSIQVWTLDQPMTKTNHYYDIGLYTITQFIQNSVQNMAKVYPALLTGGEDAEFYKKIPQHWELSKEHVNDLEKFLDKYYKEIERFSGDKSIQQLLHVVSTRLVDLNIFLQNIPTQTEIVKDTIIDDKPEKVTFHGLFDKECIYMLYTYCFYSCIFEYISCALDPSLIQMDIEEKKSSRRSKIQSSAEVSEQLMGLSRVQEGEEDYDNELREIDIQMGNSLELKERVCTLLCTFLNLEKENKSSVDYTYSDIIKRVSRSKQKEKDEIISKFTKMDSEERKVEDMMKNFRIGRWNVGQQKGLFAYNPDTYDRERDEMLTRVLNDMGEGTLDIVDEDLMEIYNLDELSKRQQDQAEIEEMNELLNGLGNNFMDGEYYEEDQLDAEDYF
uniref:Uncharacterized protein n=1 Tax=viral metagenome TaxID=1070528 RepID=A0A6C0AST6_9ZZZZ